VLALGILAGCQQVPPAPISAERVADAFAARSLEDPLLRGFLEAGLGRALPDWPLRRWDLEALTLAALFHQPSLEVARAQWQIAHGAIETAGARPNPTLTLTPERSLNPGDAVSPWLATVQLDLPIETAGKRGHRIARAESLEAAARRGLVVEAWRVRRALRTALVDLAAALERRRLLAARISGEQALARLIEQRVQAGAASEADAALLRLALLYSRAELGDAERRALAALARVSAAIGVPVHALESVEIAFALGSGADPLAGASEADARRRALLGRADVLAALDAYAAAEAALRLELARQYPDLHLGPGYQFDQGQNKWGLGVSIELPILNQNQGPIAEAAAARAESAARFTALQAQVVAEIEQALAERRGAREQVAQLEALAAEQARRLGRARDALALGAIDRPAELAAELELQRGRLALVDARQALEQSLAALEAALQGPLVAPEMLERPGRLAMRAAP
jgi:outer membrane protein TolC